MSGRAKTFPASTPLAAVIAAVVSVTLLAACNGRSGTPAGGTASAEAVSIPALAPPLTHSGRWLTDASGRVVIFHGINVAMKLRPYTPQAQGFTREHAAMLAREGFSHVRVWVFWNAIEPAPGVWDDSSLQQLREFIGWLNDYGITTTLNFSQLLWGEEFGGLGFPDWAAKTDGFPNVAISATLGDIGLPTPGGNLVVDGLTNPAVHRAFDNFYANALYPANVGLADQFAAAWQHVAAYFKNVPGLVAYDLFNEPEAGTLDPLCLNPLGCPEFDLLTLNPFNEKIVAAIRQIDPLRAIVYEPQVYAATGFATSVAAGNDSNVMLGAHFYPLAGSSGIQTTAPLALQNFENDAVNNGDAWLLSEFGAKDDLTLISGTIDAADAARVGWLYWAWYSTEPTGNPATPTTQIDHPEEGIVKDPTKPPTEDNLKGDKLAVLGRPYPYLVAGTPQSWSFDASSRTFKLSYSTTPVAGGALLKAPTVVVVPSRLYPSGYQVSVSGAQVSSQENSNALMLQATGGATTVTVTISPR